MSKKLLTIVIILCLIVSLVSCKTATGSLTDASSGPSEETTATETIGTNSNTEETSMDGSVTDSNETQSASSNEGNASTSNPSGGNASGSNSNPSSSNKDTSSTTSTPSNSSTPSQPTTSTPPSGGTSSTTTPSAPTAPARECINRPDLAQQLFAEINKHRKANGVPELRRVAQNDTYAYNQAWYNAKNDVPAKQRHTVDQIGVTGNVYGVGEIVPDAINAWKNSPGHNFNMLDAEYDKAGVSVIEIKKNGLTVEFVAIVDFDTIDWAHPDRGVTTQ